MDFSKLTSVRIGENAEQISTKAVCLLNIWVTFSIQFGQLKEQKHPSIVVKGLHHGLHHVDTKSQRL